MHYKLKLEMIDVDGTTHDMVPPPTEPHTKDNILINEKD